MFPRLRTCTHGPGAHLHTLCRYCLFPQVVLATLWIKIADDPHIPVKQAWHCWARRHNHLSTCTSTAGLIWRHGFTSHAVLTRNKLKSVANCRRIQNIKAGRSSEAQKAKRRKPTLTRDDVLQAKLMGGGSGPLMPQHVGRRYRRPNLGSRVRHRLAASLSPRQKNVSAES